MPEKPSEILIVDDNPENLRVLSAVLEREGYAVRVATTGAQALESIEAQQPDLLLLDLHLPGMNGLEVARAIRRDATRQSMPIVFLSALGDTFNKLQGLEAGANDYMTKPFDAEEVKARVKMHLGVGSKLLELERLRRALAQKDAEIARLRAELGRES